MAWLELAVAEQLRLFLPAGRRAAQVRLPWDGEASLGHVVQAAGIPLTEVGVLQVGDASVPSSARPPTGTLVTVSAMARPQALPTDVPRFVLDVHLGALARRLRLLGLDAAYRNDAGDGELVAQALGERRLLLTQDRGLLRRRALHGEPRWAAYVRGDGPDAQLRDVLDRFDPPLAPFTRCPACNGLLAPVPKADVVDRLQPGTRRRYDEFRRCAACGQVYWHGAHARRLDAIVAGARAGAAAVALVEPDSRALPPAVAPVREERR